jgi:hypothetical protein
VQSRIGSYAIETVLERVGTRTDVYSAAVLLYEMLAGRPPLHLAADSGVSQSRHDIAAALKSLVPDLPSGVSETVAIALRPDPRQRFQRMEEFLRALQEGAVGFLPLDPAIADAASTTGDIGPLSAAEPWPARRYQLVGLAVFLLLSGIGVITLYRRGVTRHQLTIPSGVAADPGGAVGVRSAPAVKRPPERPQPPTLPKPRVSLPKQAVAEPLTELPARGSSREEKEPDPVEMRRQALEQAREEIRRGIREVEMDGEAHDFTAAQRKLDALIGLVQRFPTELLAEGEEIHALRQRLTDDWVALQAAEREKELQAAAWEERLRQIEKLMEQNLFPEAENLAVALSREPGVPESVAERACELSTRAKSELKRIWSETEIGSTRNELRKPRKPPAE